MSCC